MNSEQFQGAAVRRYTAFAVIAALVTLFTGALFATGASADPDPKVWVCKYVGKPGVDERLKEGKNPIEVSVNATGGTEVGSYFSDAQGRSYVAAVVEKGVDPPECPAADNPNPDPDPGDDQTPDPGDDQTPDPGDDQTPDPGDDQTPDPGDDQTPDPGDGQTDEPTEGTTTGPTPGPTTTQPAKPAPGKPAPGKPGGPPSAAPTDLAPASTAGAIALLVAATALFGAAFRFARGARQH